MKFEFENYVEVDNNTVIKMLCLYQYLKFQVICIGDEEGVGLVKEAIKQVIKVHEKYGVPFFHIGADEAFEVIFKKFAEQYEKNERIP